MGPHSQIFLYYPTIAFSLQSSLSLSYSLKTNNHNTTFSLPTRQDRSLSLSLSSWWDCLFSLSPPQKKFLYIYIYIYIYVLFIYLFYTLSRLGLVVGVGVGVVMVASVGFSLFPSMDGYGVVVPLWVWIWWWWWWWR